MKKAKKILNKGIGLAVSLGSVISFSSRVEANTTAKRQARKQKKMSTDCAVIVARGGKAMLT